MVTPLSPGAFDAVDLFAGPGGWDVAAQRLGLSVLGFELDEAARLTRDAAGHHTATTSTPVTKTHKAGVRGLSVTEVSPRNYLTRGQIGSPPCQGFSLAGKGAARKDSVRLLAELAEVRTRTDLDALIASAREWMTHEGTALVLEPLRWAMTCAPSWIAWEQVPGVQPLWDACATILRARGWSVETAVLHAEQYGVPQTRNRAVLVGRAPWLAAEIGPVSLPTPTHSRYHSRTPGRLDPDVPRWVSLAEALEWAPIVADHPTIGWSAVRPSTTVLTEARIAAAGHHVTHQGATSVRSDDVARWTHENAAGEPITDGSDAVWETRPATTLVSSFRPDVVAGPGYRKPGDGPRQNAPGSVRVTVAEAAVLQSFPADYPWQGAQTKQFQQIGNAVPPLLAHHVLAAVLGVPVGR